MKKVAVVILNWNGKNFLERYLPSVVKYSEDEADIIVADNASSDDSISFLRLNYPQIKVIEHQVNYGFAQGYNEALKNVKSDYYVLLNSDVEVTKNWITPIINLLETEENIAACQPKIKDFHNKECFEYAGAAGGFIDKHGYPFCQGRVFETIEKDENQYDEIKEIFWATGASLFIKSELYHKVGGLDNFFFAHMEEIDLCWRLKNQGYKIMYCPYSTVYHLGGGTLNKIKTQKTFLNFRNSLLMLHKNLPKNYRLKVIGTRLLLDGLSGVKFLLLGKPKHIWAIIRAHFSFYRAMGQNKLKREAPQQVNLTGKINQSILVNYYLKRIFKSSSIIK